MLLDWWLKSFSTSISCTEQLVPQKNPELLNHCFTPCFHCKIIVCFYLLRKQVNYFRSAEVLNFSHLLSVQRSTQSRGIPTADPATCPSCTTASGFIPAQPAGVKMATFGVPPPITTIQTKAGDSVLWRVSHPLIRSKQGSSAPNKNKCSEFELFDWNLNPFCRRQAAAVRPSGILTLWQTAVISLTSRLLCLGARLGSAANSRGQTC